jgi:hypothetical protein
MARTRTTQAVAYAVAGVISALLAVCAAQTPQPKPARTVLLDVVKKSYDVEGDETLIYLRVYSDGLAEAHPMREVDFRHVVFLKKQLSPQELDNVRSLLTDPATRALARRYERFWGNKDFGYQYHVSNLASEKKQITDLVSFQPFAAREQKKPYPPQLERLGCMIWKLRVEVTGEALEKDWLRGCADLGY